MADYIYACPNGGKCRQIELAKSGIYIDEVNYGVKTGTKYHHGDVPSIMHYKNCTGCYLPLNASEAVKLNQFLGNKIPDTPVDEDFMKVLDGI